MLPHSPLQLPQPAIQVAPVQVAVIPAVPVEVAVIPAVPVQQIAILPRFLRRSTRNRNNER